MRSFIEILLFIGICTLSILVVLNALSGCTMTPEKEDAPAVPEVTEPEFSHKSIPNFMDKRLLENMPRSEQETLLKSAVAEWQLGKDVASIQQIRNDVKYWHGEEPTPQQIADGLNTFFRETMPEGHKLQPIFLYRVKVLAEWVYANFERGFDKTLVGNSYQEKCARKTLPQIRNIIKNGKQDQKQRAWNPPEQNSM